MRIFLFTAMVFLSLASIAQIPIEEEDGGGGGGGGGSITFSGPTSANLNDYDYYYVNASGGTHHSTSYAVSGGSITSQTKGRVRVKWTSTGTRWVRAVAEVGDMFLTKYVYVTVSSPPLVAGGIGNAQTLCYNGNPSTISNTSSASGGCGGGYSYQWQYSTNGSTFYNISGATGTTYNPGALTSSRWYRRRVKANSCSGYKYTNSIKVTIRPNLTPGTINNAQTLCYNGNPSTLGNTSYAGGGSGSIAYQWQYSTNGSSGWTNISGATGSTYNPGNLTSSRWHRRRAKSSGCSNYVYSNSVKVTIYGNLSAGSITGAQSRCYNQAPSSLNNVSGAGGGVSRSYVWEKSTSSGSSGFTAIGGTNSSSYTPPTSNQTTWYRRRVNSGSGCGSKVTNAVKVTYYGNLSAGSITGAQSRCYNQAPSSLNNVTGAGGGVSRTYVWEKSTSSATSGFTSISGTNSSSYTPPTTNQTTWYRRRVNSGSGCGSKVTSAVKVTYYGNLSAGSITGTQSRCYNQAPSSLNNVTGAGGGVSRSYVWEKSTSSGSSGFTAISGTNSSSYTPPTSNQTTWYRRRVNSGSGCGSKVTSAVKVTYYGNLSAGGINGAQNLCYNEAPSSLNNVTGAGGGVSRTYVWEKSTSSATSGFAAISGTNSSSYTPPTSNQTTWYRRRVNSGSGCGSKVTSAVKVTYYGNLLAGSINGAQNLCYNEAPSSLNNVTGAGGGVSRTYVWEKSTSSATSGFTSISGTNSSSYTPPTSNQTTWYRRKVNSGSGCGSEVTSAIKVAYYGNLAAGSISGAQSLCYNEAPSSLSSVTGASGGVSRTYTWEKSTTSASTGFTGISGTNSSSYAPTTTNQTTWYRRKVTSGSGCGDAYTNAVQVEYYNDLIAGSISGAQTLCYDQPPGIINSTSEAEGGVSGTYQWEESTTSGSDNFTAITGATSSTYTPPMSNQTTWYRRRVTSASSCGDVSTSSVKITVDPSTVAGTVSSSPNAYCGTNTGTFTLSGYTGTIKRWQYRYKNGSDAYTAWTTFEETNNIASINYTMDEWTDGIRTYQIRAVVKSGVCASKYPNKTVTVNPQPVLYTVTGGGNYCVGNTGVSVGLSGSEINVNYQLRRGATDLQILSGTGGILDFGIFTEAGTYTVEAVHSEGSCSEDMTGSAVVGVDTLPQVFTVAGGGSYCTGENGVTITLSDSQSGVNYTLMKGGTNVSTIAGTGNPINFGNQTQDGQYTVIGINAATACESLMEGEADVLTKPGPSTAVISSVTYGFEGSTITREDPPTGETWFWQSTSTGIEDLNDSPTYLAVDPGTYYLRAKRDNGCWSDAVFVTLGASEPAVVSATMVSNESLEVTWSEVLESDGYKVSRSISSSEGYVEIYTAPAGTLSYTDEGLSTGTTYNYRIQSIVGGQLSAAIKVASATTSSEFNGTIDLEHKPVFNGNISAIRWKGVNDESEQVFAYAYDGLNRLNSAQYAARAGSTYGENNGYYSVPSIAYDLNGNIQTLTRQGKNEANNADIIDELTYTYGVGGSNQLMKVDDTRGGAGFKDGSNTGDDYAYDANGNMKQDLNKGITSIEYNHLNLPATVILDLAAGGEGSGRIEYLYDAAGIKLQQKVYMEGLLEKTTDYVGQFIYENDTLQLIQHNEGRIIPVTLSGGEESYDYQYHIKDHLGNVRLTFSTEAQGYTMIEDFEGGDNGFSDLHPHTHGNANTTTGGSKVELLQSGQTGALVLVSLNKGDTIDLYVNANYESAPSGNAFLNTAHNALFTSFDNAFGGGGEGGISGSATEFQDALTGAGMAGKDDASTAPRAFVNYIFFDKDMNYVTAGFEQISTAAQGVGVHETVLIEDIVADKEGYLLAYLSNENAEAVNVHFDDFIIDHGKTNVVQSDDYYPFGLTFNGYQRTASTPQKFLYNGKELQEETRWLDYGARMYMADLGRWFAIDPMAEATYTLTPYHYVYNNPLLFVDPDGMFGDFYNEKGEHVGSDGIDDGKVFVIKTTQSEFDSGAESAGISKGEARATEKFIEENSGDTKAFQENNLAYKNSIEIEGSSETRQHMVNAVNGDNGKGGTGDANNREYGGEISIRGEVTASAPGTVSDPSQGGADITHSTFGEDTRTTFHSHPSGTKSITTGGGANTIGGRSTTAYSFRQAPSPHDVSEAGNVARYVFGKGSGKVYIYNNQGVQATIPEKRFVTPKR